MGRDRRKSLPTGLFHARGQFGLEDLGLFGSLDVIVQLTTASGMRERSVPFMKSRRLVPWHLLS